MKHTGPTFRIWVKEEKKRQDQKWTLVVNSTMAEIQ